MNDALSSNPAAPTKEQIGRMVHYEAVSNGTPYRVGGFGGRRAEEIGTVVGILSLKHAAGYEVVLQFDDGRIDSFNPNELFPAG